VKRGFWIGALAVLVFALVLLIRFPARWLSSALPDAVRCERPGGSLWRGSCAALIVDNRPFGRLSWQLFPTRLLRGALGARIDLQGEASVSADIDATLAGAVTARAVRLQAPLDPRVLPGVPAGLTGTAAADLPAVRYESGHIASVQGRIEVRGLAQRNAQNQPLPVGDYELVFPGAESGGEPTGALRDLGGPFAVSGSVRLTRERTAIVNALVAPRAGAPQELVRQLQILGPPDAQGNRAFAFEASY
jgi:hypothetical protein